MIKWILIWIFSVVCSATAFAQTEKAPDAVFVLNGDTTRLPKNFEDVDPLNGDYYLSSKKLNINISARMAPEVILSFKIFITNFNQQDLQQGNAIGMLMRRNSNQENLVTYSSNYQANGVQGFIKLTITNFTIKSMPSKNQYGEAFISGIFEGDLLCTSCGLIPGDIQHITSGRFEQVPIAIWN